MVDDHVKCPICNTKPDYQKIKAIMAEGSSSTIPYFDPEDPVIVSESEIYCSSDCYARAVIKEETAHEW